MPIRTQDGKSWEVVEDVPMNDFSREKFQASLSELKEERQLVGDLL